ncbi:hypothetical protein CGLAU_03825 [Corynebacterium glaucum]|uniref:Uncharacterized protein n=1 Tax=Corynebacterium glaucum TaxID=187491 RepID=A0A1Q2HV75_9CORY|nr:gephyrin-like molybdotransferase receptor GlpR [Corynebacterium glaucum]AQQ14742.1 hypothetical protein CGLAU_03825 [Corynebacterium glaucum]
MGSPSLIILLIVVVWVIVLAPLAFGNNKPIRRSGQGYEETRVLHEGGTMPMVERRRPKLTAADVHHYEASEDEDYELVEAVSDEEQVLIDDTSASMKTLISRTAGVSRKLAPNVIEADEVEEVKEAEAAEGAEGAEGTVESNEVEAPAAGGSTAYSVLQAQAEDSDEDEDEDEAQAEYELAESYLAPADFGYVSEEASAAAEDQAVVLEHGETDTEDNAADSDIEVAADADTSSVELEDADIAFAEARKGRGGYDPQRDALTRADRLKRRKITFISLLAASAITLIAALIVGGWMWVLPAITVGLTLWFMVALRRVVKQEQELRARRMRQLRRARLGVDTEDRPAIVERERYRAGAVIMDLDDESPDFDHLPRYRQAEPEYGTIERERRVPVRVGGRYDDFGDDDSYDDYESYGDFGDRAS